MELYDVLHGIKINNQAEILKNISIDGLSFHSNKVQKNEVFIAISGGRHDGHDYIKQAINHGAAAVVGEKEIKEELPVPYIRVQDSRKALAKMAANYYKNPAKKHIMIGITGTNGKTTTAFMLKHLIEEAGYTCAMFGSVVNVMNGKEFPAVHTTPDSLELNRLLHVSDDDFVVMEVSSHALSQARVEGIEFDYCLFTNLGHDHLDYHKSFEEYFSVKASLFNQLKSDGFAIVNIDNQWGEKLQAILEEKKINTISLSQFEEAEWTFRKTLNGLCPSVILKNRQKEELHFHVKMPGEHNIYNSVMALITGRKIGIAIDKLVLGILSFKGAPGRFEMIDYDGITIVIDYAHTADAFEHCLKAAHECGAKKVFHVFGFRGGRDETKRGDMLQTSVGLADCCILTLDDLNNVPFDSMVLTMSTLNKEYGRDKGEVIPDRTLAIKNAIKSASCGDWVFITGKGNESYKFPFEIGTSSDTETVLFLREGKEKDWTDAVI
ncbi:UDP-N-acetylmuramoyl-L-alanyl-D-glutamate--2,6-diaminopimelate ligase [Bacillus songklensis]|uniref:UDP-N-acetylmuramoyl-L-alanyl-D-glutamate--2, 6-diaminopimelate ligase n=1 Tax=Bacillus songklensis TaxID=1069116 RepID=A0ABV8B2F2_9BACI